MRLSSSFLSIKQIIATFKLILAFISMFSSTFKTLPYIYVGVSFAKIVNGRNSPPEVFLRKGILKICGKYVVNHNSIWVLFCKFAAYFQNTFSQEHLWVTTSVTIFLITIFSKRFLYRCFTGFQR